MTIEKAIKTLDDVIPPPDNKMVDGEHLDIAIAWQVVKALVTQGCDGSPRTPDYCRYVKRYGLPEQIDGLCEGFQRSETDDEPAELCKGCKHNYFNAEEEDAS